MLSSYIDIYIYIFFFFFSLRLFIFDDYFTNRDITYNINLLLHTVLTLLTPLMLFTVLE